jgi:hypothetical protein
VKKRKKSIGKKDYRKGNQENDGLNMPQGDMRRVTNYPREVRRAKRKTGGLELARPGRLISGLLVTISVLIGILTFLLFPRGGVVAGAGVLGLPVLLVFIHVIGGKGRSQSLNLFPLSVTYTSWFVVGSLILHYGTGKLNPVTDQSQHTFAMQLMFFGWVPLFFLIVFIAMAVIASKTLDDGLDEL